MKKSLWNGVYLISFLLASLVIGGVYAIVDKSNSWQSENEVFISTNDFSGNLKNAIDSGSIKGSNFSVNDVSNLVSNPGHGFDEIWVSVNGEEMALSDALAGKGLCGTSSPTTTYSNSLIVGHYATEVEINVSGTVESLQDAINNGEIAKTDGGWSDWGECSNGTKARTCTNPSPFCGGAECIGNSTSSEGCAPVISYQYMYADVAANNGYYVGNPSLPGQTYQQCWTGYTVSVAADECVRYCYAGWSWAWICKKLSFDQNGDYLDEWENVADSFCGGVKHSGATCNP